MSINDAALSIIKSSESLRLTAYICPAGVLTIGYGHTGSDVKKGMTITKERAEQLLRDDVSKTASAVRSLVKAPINENQLGALVSLVFNIGTNAFKDSTLLRLLNAGDILSAADQFPRWNKSKGKVLNGLTKRRAAERELFLKPV